MDMLRIYEKIIDDQRVFFLPYTEKDWLGNINNVLTEKEKVRASCIKNLDSQKQFIFGRYLIRQVLNKNYRLDVNGKDFFYNKFGKPFLEGSIFFNLSHTKGLIVLIVSKDKENGIDVEVNRDNNIAWTRYESYIKSLGNGLTGTEFKDFCSHDVGVFPIKTEIESFNNKEYVWSCCVKP